MNRPTSAIDRLRDQQIGGGYTPPVASPSAPAPMNADTFARLSFADGAPRMPMSLIGLVLDTNGQQALQTNPDRGYLYIQNNSNANIQVNFDRDAQFGMSMIIGPGGFYEPRVVPTNAIYIASASLASANVIVIEGTMRPR